MNGSCKFVENSHLPLLVVIKVLRYQAAALVAASIIGGAPWTSKAGAATFPAACSSRCSDERTETLRSELSVFSASPVRP